jgi:hypothetical protein
LTLSPQRRVEFKYRRAALTQYWIISFLRQGFSTCPSALADAEDCNAAIGAAA